MEQVLIKPLAIQNKPWKSWDCKVMNKKYPKAEYVQRYKCTVKKFPRLPYRIWNLFGWDNRTIWNTIHFMIDGRQSIWWKDILDTIQLYPEEIWKGAGIQSNRNRNETWKVIQIVQFYKPLWSTTLSRKGTRKTILDKDPDSSVPFNLSECKCNYYQFSAHYSSHQLFNNRGVHLSVISTLL